MGLVGGVTRASRFFYLRLSRFSARKRISGSDLCALTILRHLANLQAPNALRQGIPLLLCEPSAASASLRYPCSSPCESNTRPGQRLRLPRASIIVEMLPGCARDGPLP